MLVHVLPLRRLRGGWGVRFRLCDRFLSCLSWVRGGLATVKGLELRECVDPKKGIPVGRFRKRARVPYLIKGPVSDGTIPYIVDL